MYCTIIHNLGVWGKQLLLFVGLFTFTMLLLTHTPAPLLHAQTSQRQPHPTIALKTATFDPLVQKPTVAAVLQSQAIAGQQQTYMVQFVGPIQPGWKQQVEATGARLYGYLPAYTFLARMAPTTATNVAQLAPVRWVGLYHPAYRLSPNLLSFAQAAATSDKTSPPPAPQDFAMLNLTVQGLPDADLDRMTQAIEALGGEVTERDSNPFAAFLALRLPAYRLVELAHLDEITWIEQTMPVGVANDVSTGSILQATTIHNDYNLYGNGQVIGIADTGLDTGKGKTLHPDLRERLHKSYCLGRTNPCDWSDASGHGTHIAGSALGNGSVSGGDADNHTYDGSFAGTAPEAKLVFQSLLDTKGFLSGVPTDRGNLMRQAYTDGARIHTNAWGGPTSSEDGGDQYGEYVLSSAMVDFAMWEHKDMLVLFTSGNGGVDGEKDGQGQPVGNGIIDADAIEQPGTAKNVLTIGASESERTFASDTWGGLWQDEFPAEPIASDKTADNRAGMAAFSSRGPTDDGRIKPDLVAPGTGIISLRSREYLFEDDMEAANTAGRYTTDDVYGGTGKWSLVDNYARSGSHAWQLEVINAWSSLAATMLFTPPFYISEAGAAHLTFWHACNLASSSTPAIKLRGTSFWNSYETTTTPLMPLSLFTDNTSCSGDFSFVDLPPFLAEDIAYQYGIDPAQEIQIGFGVKGQTGVYQYGGTWTIDDVRVDGYSDHLLSSIDMASPGSALDDGYMVLSGSSMSTALTAGAAALVRDWLKTYRNYATPQAALVKALLLNGATHPVPGQYGIGDQQEIPNVRPNTVSGWGRVDVAKTLAPPEPMAIWFRDVTNGIQTNEQRVFRLRINPTGEATDHPVSITLVWTDYPGEPAASKALVNDLDLALIAPGSKLHRGNAGVYAADDACLDSSFDTCNTVESIFLPNAPRGLYRVYVTGVHVPAEDNQSGGQPFALVVSGPGVMLQPTVYLPLVMQQ